MRDKRQSVMGVICVLTAAALLLGQLSVNFAGIFAEGELYSGGAFKLSAPSVLAGFAAAACSAAVIFIFAKLYKGGRGASAAAVVFALFLRVVFAFAWKIEPESDFLITYDLSRMLAEIPFKEWSGALAKSGTIYANQWSAHMPFIIYQTIILKIFGTRAAAIRLANAFFSALTCVFAAGTARKISGDKAGFITLLVTAVNPLSLFYIPVLTNQHAASCFFMAAVWVFYVKPVKNPYLNAALGGALTAASHLLRPEMYAVIIAAALIAAFEGKSGKRPLESAARFAVFAAVFFSVLLAADGVLSVNNITNQSILSGNLKYKIAVGLDPATTGTWSEADAELIFDDKRCAAVIAERLSEPERIAPLVIKKTAYQFGSFAYTWSMKNDFVSNEIYRRLSSAVMAAAVMCAVFTLVFGKERRKKIFPLVIILAVFMAVFAVIEVQPRYNYLLVPVIIIIASDVFNRQE